MNYKEHTNPGIPLPLGTTVEHNGVNFSIFSRNATSVELSIFNDSSDLESYETYLLDPVDNKTGDIWHIFVENKSQGTLYLYKMDGLWAPEEG
ncbi:MAG: hypothetical protein B6229_09035, partial [Spirochaetaceae bacterium 4572_7]